MGQSMQSTGGGKQKGASSQQRNQPEAEPGQKMADQGGHGKSGRTGKGKPIICRFCDSAKFDKHVEAFHQVRDAAARGA